MTTVSTQAHQGMTTPWRDTTLPASPWNQARRQT